MERRVRPELDCMSFNAQLVIAIVTALTPTVAVFLGVLIQRQDSRDLRSEMTALRKDMQSDMVGLRKDMQSDIAGLRKDMQSDIAGLRKDMQSDMLSLRNQVHADLLMIHERVAKVEARQGH